MDIGNYFSIDAEAQAGLKNPIGGLLRTGDSFQDFLLEP